jgi:hypothetical protein
VRNAAGYFVLHANELLSCADRGGECVARTAAQCQSDGAGRAAVAQLSRRADENADGINLGSLCAVDTEERQFTAARIGIMESFAAIVANELELRMIAGQDALTGVSVGVREGDGGVSPE